MLHLAGSTHGAKSSANGPTWWHAPRWRKQEPQSTQRRWLAMCLASLCLTGQRVTVAALHVPGGFLHVTGAFSHVNGASSHVTGAALRMTGASLHVPRAFLHAFLVGLAVHDRQSPCLSVCIFVTLSPCSLGHMWHCHLWRISFPQNRRHFYASINLPAYLSVCLPVCLSVCS